MSSLAKAMAPIVATMVARELKENGDSGERPRKATSRKKNQLKHAVKLEKEAETSQCRNSFLVSTVRLKY
jgi:hypothetical protein